MWTTSPKRRECSDIDSHWAGAFCPIQWESIRPFARACAHDARVARAHVARARWDDVDHPSDEGWARSRLWETAPAGVSGPLRVGHALGHVLSCCITRVTGAGGREGAACSTHRHTVPSITSITAEMTTCRRRPAGCTPSRGPV